MSEKDHRGLGEGVNEKPKTSKLPEDLGFLLHAQFGIDHYPDYLRKWTDADLGRLLALAEAQVDSIKEAMRDAVERRALASAYVPVHPHLRSIQALEDGFSPQVRAALQRGRPAALRKLLRREAPGVYSFPLLSAGYCAQLREEACRFSLFSSAQTGDAADRDGAAADGAGGSAGEQRAKLFGKHTAALRDFGLDSVQQALVSLIVRPLSRVLFAESGGASLDWQFAYVAGYAARGGVAPNATRTALVPHTDDSEVTLNVCLHDAFSGGALAFRGLRGSESEGSVEATYQPVLGRAVLHRGQHLHEVQPVTAGERQALIVWCRSSRFRRGTCPCCALNRRDDRCVCSRAWN